MSNVNIFERLFSNILSAKRLMSSNSILNGPVVSRNLILFANKYLNYSEQSLLFRVAAMWSAGDRLSRPSDSKNSRSSNPNPSLRM